ncbi:MAG: hypothetical protein JXA07_02625 [Spirochaetes bacterium]|nr:hypothetical protein [Spirochaetota bacterium]
MTTKIYIIIFASSLGLLVLWAIVGGILESRGVTVDPATVKAVSFILFLILGFTIVPLMIRLFILGQIRIGHGDLAIIKFLRAHESAVVYCIWGFYLIGLIYLLPLIKRDIF